VALSLSWTIAFFAISTTNGYSEKENFSTFYALSGLGEFEQGGQNRHKLLKDTGDILTTFAQYEENQEPRQITLQEIWNYVQLRQSQAAHAQSKKLFAESCKWNTAQTLYACQNTDIPTELRFDPKHQIIGWWAENGKIIGTSVITGLHPVAPAFYGDEITSPLCWQKRRIASRWIWSSWF
jgi:hypothetical protein